MASSGANEMKASVWAHPTITSAGNKKNAAAIRPRAVIRFPPAD
jgi:hypothetical protein